MAQRGPNPSRLGLGLARRAMIADRAPEVRCRLLGAGVFLATSAAGIALFPGFSLGIWGWFKG